MINQIIKKSFNTIEKLLTDNELENRIELVIDEIINCFKKGNRVYLCGNGGSAADAQHIAGELSGRFYFDRPPLPAEALHVNSSYITAVANDYSYDEIYSRYIAGMGKEGDILIGLSTSGNSQNVVKAIETANKNKLITIGFTGSSGGRMKDMVNYLINVPSDDTPRIQEAHILIGHIICEIVEKEMFGNK